MGRLIAGGLQLLARGGRAGVGGLGRVGNALGGLGDLLNLGNAVAKNIAPQIRTRISCTVTCQPGSDFKRCYRLALAICFGAIKSRKDAGIAGLLPPMSSLAAHFDPIHGFLGVELNYSLSNLGNILDDVAANAKGNPLATILPVFQGFPDQVVGDEFSQLNLLERQFLGNGPQLEAANKTVLTTKPTLPSPAVGGDLIGRAFLEGLVARSLLGPDHFVAHRELVEKDAHQKRPGSAQSYTPAKGPVPTPAQNQGKPSWQRFWEQKGVKIPECVA
ncbi:hypothetical protein [Limnoglobus roseus]|uniref:Uncharacterized protein n=1 Tax=Limnoglobus roseus TaxID=2598579 RepID=A0A5C1ALK1_9BACT|nr:hypothetical protein [Limnoglobus roseus]QEL19830.1 hypothetical protein PX52LOC_06911 [Limnoglobus roseus]